MEARNRNSTTVPAKKNGDRGILTEATGNSQILTTPGIDLENQSQQALLNLKLKALNCQFGWFEDLAGRADAGLPVHKVEEQHIKRLNSWIDETKNAQHPIAVNITQLTIGAIYDCRRGRLNEATMKVLELEAFVRGIYEKLKDEKKEGQAHAYKYVLFGSQAFLAFEKKDYLKVKDRLAKGSALNVKEAEMESMLLVLRASFLAHVMPGMDEQRLRYLRQAVRLDQTSAEAKHYLYRGIRKFRRAVDHLGAPEREEIHMAKGARDLKPDAIWTQSDMVTLERELKWSGINVSFRHANTSQVLASTDEESISMRVFNASCKSLRFSEADSQFKELLKKWPESSEVLHKAGAFYSRRGITPEVQKKGLELMLKSVMNNGDVNYKGLFEYMDIKYKLEGNGCVEEILDLINRSLEIGPNTEKVHRIQLKLTKGMIIWSQGDHKLANNIWLEAVLENPLCIEHSLREWLVGDRTIRGLISNDEKRAIVKGFAQYLESQIQCQAQLRAEASGIHQRCHFVLTGRQLSRFVTQVDAGNAGMETGQRESNYGSRGRAASSESAENIAPTLQGLSNGLERNGLVPGTVGALCGTRGPVRGYGFDWHYGEPLDEGLRTKASMPQETSGTWNRGSEN